MRKLIVYFAFYIVTLSTVQPCLAGVEWTHGKQLSVDAAPIDIALSPDGKWLFVLAPGEVLIYETRGDKIINRIPLEQTFDTISYSASDNTLLVGSRSEKVLKLIRIEAVYSFSMSGLPFKGPEDAPVTITVFSDYQ